MAIAVSKKLQNAQTTVSRGEWIDVTDADKLVIHVFGTSTAFTVDFEGSLDSNEHHYPIGGINQKDQSTLASSVSVDMIGQAWEFDVSALATFTANLSLVSNGNISVVANIPR